MIYYFYSKNPKLKGLMNFRLLKADLYTDKRKCAEAAQRMYDVGPENPVGFIYSCRRMNNIKSGENLNHRYKSDTPVWITGCEYIADIYAEYEADSKEELKF